MIEAVIFDMDGLMIDSEPFWQQAEIEEFRKVDIQLNKTLCEQTMGVRIDEVVQHWYAKHPWDLQRMPLETMQKNIVDKVIEQILSEGVIMKGVLETIAFFQRRPLKLALASSSERRIIDAVLESLKLSDVFSVIHSAEHEEYGKPHPAVYLSTAKMLNVLPSHCLALEDSINGMIAAKSAKMKCLVVPEAGNTDPRFALADKQLTSLSEFGENVWEALNS